MKIIEKNNRKEKKVLFSCVVDDSPVFFWQGMTFVISLVEIAKVNPQNIYIHMLKENPAFEAFLERKGVNKLFITPWGDKKYCNKLQQIETLELQKADFVFLCDADIAVLEDLSEIINGDEILGKTVDYDNPDIDKLKSIFDHFNLSYPLENSETFNGQLTFDGNFNGGLYGMPGKYLRSFGGYWRRWAKALLESSSVSKILDNKIIHIDQIAFCMALQESKYSYRKLDLSFNCPTHLVEFDPLPSQLKNSPSILHFHSNLSSIGLLNNVGVHLIDNSISKVNYSLEKHFENELFWNFRYKFNPDLGSGLGSRGEIATYKINLLKIIGIENDSSILDVGCGDMEIIKQLNLSKYTGVDLSDEALKKAKTTFPGGIFYHFIRDRNKIIKSDTVLCFDVLIHQESNENYMSLINFLVAKTKRRLIVSGYRKKTDKSHMCFFYEDIVTSLKKTNNFKYVFKIGSYRGVDVILADKGDLGSYLKTKATLVVRKSKYL